MDKNTFWIMQTPGGALIPQSCRYRKFDCMYYNAGMQFSEMTRKKSEGYRAIKVKIKPLKNEKQSIKRRS